MSILCALIDTEEKYKRHKKARDIKNIPVKLENKIRKISHMKEIVDLAKNGSDLRKVSNTAGISTRTLQRWKNKILSQGFID